MGIRQARWLELGKVQRRENGTDKPPAPSGGPFLVLGLVLISVCEREQLSQ